MINQAQFYKLCARAGRISILMFLLPVALLGLTVAVPVNPVANPVEIYAKNISSIAAYFALGLFLSRLILANTTDPNNQNMKPFDFSILFLVIASIIKSTVSLIYFFMYLTSENLLCLYYLGELLVWISIVYFAIALRREVKKGTLLEKDVMEEEDSMMP